MSDFRGDGEAALDWVAGYLERVGELPVASPVSPGEVRARLPPSPPERGEPFEAVLRDLDAAILPGITHWNHPRFFGYFANTGSEPGILAELIVAALNVNAMLWTTSPAATEVEELALDWLAQLLGLPEGLHGHIEDTASTATIVALAAARELRPGGHVLTSEHANFSVEKAARLLGLECRFVPVDSEYRMRLDLLAEQIEGAAAVVPTAGTTSTTLCGRGRLAPSRRRLCGLGRGVRGVLLDARRRRPRRLGRDQSPQVALCSDGLLVLLDAPAGRGLPRVQREPGVHAGARRDGHRPQGLRARARPPIPRPQALGGAPLLRT
jgi:hypothetical protein